MSLEEHAEELASDLGVDTEEVRADLEKLVSYSVPVDEAKQSLRRKYGDGGGSGGGQPSTVEVGEITTADSNVTVTARILTVGKRSIRYQGEDQLIYEGELADQSGRISYTAWEDFELSAGDTVTVGNAGVREWDDEPELNLGASTDVRFEDESLSVPFEIGGQRSLAALDPGDRGVDLAVVVLEVESKTIDGRDGETDILSGVLGDETGRLPFTDWDPHDAVEVGTSIDITNAYVREFRGVPQVNLSEYSTVTGRTEAVEPMTEAPRMEIDEAVATGGLFDVEVVGSVLSIRDGSGLIQRCPECGRVVQKGQCRSHGEVEGIDDLRVKAIVDDGTGTLTAVLDDELTAAIYGGNIDAAKEHAREEMDQGVVADAIREEIVGKEFRVRGTLSVDDYGANLDATAFAEVDEEPVDRARAVLAEVGE